MTLATGAAWIAWAVVVHSVDPSRSGILGLLLFYLTFTMSVFGTMALMGLLIRLWRCRTALMPRIAVRSFRQAILLSLLLSGSLILSSHGWLRWWTVFLIVIMVTCVELVFLSSRHA
ncbi:hypothetical protein HY733_02865 [Candidatus Uhrbacteria bacterium]|nr:hypothetical protein [Candidatus Uhrbacteria bacterium]